MGLEQRHDGKIYYYRKRRVGGHVVSEYVGKGGAGEFAQMLYAFAQEDRRLLQRLNAARRDQRLAKQADERAATRAVDDIAGQCDELARLLLLAAGYHQHRRQWRKRRQRAMRSERLSEEVMERIHGRAATGDAEAIEFLAKLPPDDITPDEVMVLRTALAVRGEELGDLMSPLGHALIVEVQKSSKTALDRERTRDLLPRRRAELGYDTAPALERPLIDHLVLCELRLSQTELLFTDDRHQGMDWKLIERWERRLNNEQRRYLRAVECLARIRRVRVELARVTGPDGMQTQAIAFEGPGQ